MMHISLSTKIRFFPIKCFLCPDPAILCPNPFIVCPQILSARVLYSEAFATFRTQSRCFHGSCTSPPPPIPAAWTDTTRPAAPPRPRPAPASYRLCQTSHVLHGSPATPDAL